MKDVMDRLDDLSCLLANEQEDTVQDARLEIIALRAELAREKALRIEDLEDQQKFQFEAEDLRAENERLKQECIDRQGCEDSLIEWNETYLKANVEVASLNAELVEEISALRAENKRLKAREGELVDQMNESTGNTQGPAAKLDNQPLNEHTEETP